MKKKMMMMLLTATMVFSLVGCGSKGAEAPEADTAETADDAESADADATDAETSDSGKKWIIATDTAFKPFEYKDDSGEYVGIDVDILAAIAEDQGFDYDLQALGWDASIAACQAGQADGMIAGASITDERKNSGWIFSDGYYDANQSMAVAENSSITGFADLNGKTVAVKTGSMSAEYAESLKDEYGFTVTTFEDSPTMYQAVVGGQVDAVFDDTPIMASNIKDNGLAMKLVDGTGNEPASYGFAIFNADNQELVDMFNAGLANIKANGTYDEIIAKYLGE
ncbi:MAG: transporter substrate-binding domain-containing protein [Lachnospiraceae bacterium]|nr:transporter substrate-binding domain-containing protein [Lachnospiraceae bacterium]